MEMKSEINSKPAEKRLKLEATHSQKAACSHVRRTMLAAARTPPWYSLINRGGVIKPF